MKDSLALQKHFEWRGKVETKVKVPVSTKINTKPCRTKYVCVVKHKHPLQGVPRLDELSTANGKRAIIVEKCCTIYYK